VSEAARRPTIFALSTAPGRAAIAVIRVSGPQASEAIRAMTGREPPKPRFAAFRRILRAGERIDDALVLWIPGPASETGEDMAEFHLHGGRAVTAAVLEALAEVPCLRPAGPGEFTRQAFDNGKLDLTQAEAIADLVEAETAAQRRQALRQLDGGFGQRCEAWRATLLRLLAKAEAAIDFPDEDLPAGLGPEVAIGVVKLRKEIEQLLMDRHRGERLRQGYSIAILGAPNSGKSSLINNLSGREAAIVSTRAGTTRDVIEVHLDLAGYPVVLADTAGLREPTDEIEAEGVRRARARAAAADLKLIVFDGTLWPDLDPAATALVDDNSLVILNKTDLMKRLPEAPAIAGHSALLLSAVSGDGMQDLLKTIEARVVEALGVGEAPGATRLRHRQALEDCSAALARAETAGLGELQAEDLRLAARSLGRITGRVDVEDVLDAIFREFCIGK
jgi:tRNA modification GTPase